MKGDGYTSADVARIMVAQDGRCACGCGRHLLTHGFHVDHVIPIARGGVNDATNIQLMAPICNLRKGAKHDRDSRLHV